MESMAILHMEISNAYEVLILAVTEYASRNIFQAIGIVEPPTMVTFKG